MSSSQWLTLLGGVALGHFLIPVIAWVVRGMIIEVEDEHAVLVTRFGAHVETLRTPGAHLRPAKLLPWVKTFPISLARDFRHFTNVHVNDAKGTTVLVDLWVEIRVVDPVRSRFAVEDWNHALQSLITYAATAILSERDFQGILHDRTELGERLLREVAPETERWGVSVERAFVRNVNLLPEVARHVFQTVATRIERAKAVVEERGHIDAARIEAEADLRCAAFVAEAKAQYPLAVGRGLAVLRDDPKVFEAYQSLYALAQVRPARTVAFLGFDEGSPRAVDAAMLPGVTEAMSGPARLDG